MMTEWYNDRDINIKFSDIPRIGIRYILPSMCVEEKKMIKKYPFINKQNLLLKIFDKNKNKVYKLFIPKGYCYDGASVPRFFWRIIGPNTDNKFLVAAMVHDYICENHSIIDYDRALSSEIFGALLTASEVSPFKRFLMTKSVDIFQKWFCNWRK